MLRLLSVNSSFTCYKAWWFGCEVPLIESYIWMLHLHLFVGKVVLPLRGGASRKEVGHCGGP